MQIFVVGGAVRDLVMDKTPKDYDYLIVGATQEDVQKLEADGFQQVGKDFPVLLSPSGDEYALARIERKVGLGYHGFECETEGVTLEEDLARRDFTMNAMVQDPETGEIIDPYNGQQDIHDCRIRHVSDAFAEDPVRILRAARFAARYGFDIANETMELMRNMVANGEVDALKKERVMQEFVKVVEETDTPSIFVEVLWNCGALQRLIPELPELDFAKLDALDEVVYNSASQDAFNLFIAVLFNDVSLATLDTVNTRMVLPNKANKLAYNVIKHGRNYANLITASTKAEHVVELFSSMKIRNNGGEKFLEDIFTVMNSLGYMQEHEQEEAQKLYKLFSSVDIAEEIERMAKAGTPLVGPEIRQRQEQMQVEVIEPYFA